jgi:hypothetical protein
VLTKAFLRHLPAINPPKAVPDRSSLPSALSKSVPVRSASGFAIVDFSDSEVATVALSQWVFAGRSQSLGVGHVARLARDLAVVRAALVALEYILTGARNPEGDAEVSLVSHIEKAGMEGALILMCGHRY